MTSTEWPEWMNLPMEYWGDEDLLEYVKSVGFYSCYREEYEGWPWVVPTEKEVTLHEFMCYLKHRGDDAEMIVRLLEHWINEYKSEWRQS